MKSRKYICADNGKVLTNGEIYGTRIYLAEGQSSDDFYEITAEEYQTKMESKEGDDDE